MTTPLNSQKAHDFGLLAIRGILAVVFVYHGGQKLFGLFGGGGIDATAGFFDKAGIPLPTLSAYLAGGAEFFGGLLLAAGWAFRPAAAVLTVVMLVATSVHFESGFGLQNGGYEYALTLAVVSFGLLLTGPGRNAAVPSGWFKRQHQ